jgi:carbon-monoxide dehydrogenase small subunit
VTTVEGVGTPEKPHPLQKAITEHYGAQCGFCTPGMIMSGVALLERNSHPSRDEVVTAITGNVCRCTGYKKIVESVLAAAESMK